MICTTYDLMPNAPHVASNNNIDEYADSVSEFIRKYIDDVIPTATIKSFLNQKLWIDGSIRAKNESMAVKQAKRQYRDKVELQFNGSDSRCMWQGLQSIKNYKKKSSPSPTRMSCSQTD